VSKFAKHLALFLPELALLALGSSLLFTSHRWLGAAIVAVVAAGFLFALAAGLAARRDFAKVRLKRA
jgi:hypothetical protein